MTVVAAGYGRHSRLKDPSSAASREKPTANVWAMQSLYTCPPFVMLIAAIVIVTAVACLGQAFVQRRVPREDFFQHNDVAGPMLAVVGTLYAVVLGFVTVVVWQQYDSTRARVSVESASVGDAWHSAVGLPAAVRNPLRHDMTAFASDMLKTSGRRCAKAGSVLRAG